MGVGGWVVEWISRKIKDSFKCTVRQPLGPELSSLKKRLA